MTMHVAAEPARGQRDAPAAPEATTLHRSDGNRFISNPPASKEFDGLDQSGWNHGQDRNQEPRLGIERVWLHRSFGQGSYSDEAVEVARDAGIQIIPGSCPMMHCQPVDVGHKCIRWMLGATGKLPSQETWGDHDDLVFSVPKVLSDGHLLERLRNLTRQHIVGIKRQRPRRVCRSLSVSADAQ